MLDASEVELGLADEAADAYVAQYSDDDEYYDYHRYHDYDCYHFYHLHHHYHYQN